MVVVWWWCGGGVVVVAVAVVDWLIEFLIDLQSNS